MLIIGNWKAYVETSIEAKKILEAAKKIASKKHELVLAPPPPFLALLASGPRTKVALAAQNISNVAGGAATGEVTAAIAKGAGASYAIIGHSERRAMGETDQDVAEKVKLALAAGLTPIVCVGERERDADAKYLRGLHAQLDAVFAPLTPKDRARIVIAYEPIWAIGKSADEAITPTDLDEMMLYLRKLLAPYFPARGATKVRILYGGSVDSTNVKALVTGTGVDGLLVGRASADAKSFTALVKALT